MNTNQDSGDEEDLVETELNSTTFENIVEDSLSSAGQFDASDFVLSG